MHPVCGFLRHAGYRTVYTPRAMTVTPRAHAFDYPVCPYRAEKHAALCARPAACRTETRRPRRPASRPALPAWIHPFWVHLLPGMGKGAPHIAPERVHSGVRPVVLQALLPHLARHLQTLRSGASWGTPFGAVAS